MRAYFAFTRKEFTEILRTGKFAVLLTIFLLLGIMNPLSAKLAPMLLESMVHEGITITIPEPTAMESWTQFFKNVGQLGFVVLVILFAGIMANEFNSGTLINMLTKGMKRHTVILSKLTAAAVSWMLAYLLCLTVTYGYTVYFWERIPLHHAAFAFAGPWLFGVLLITLLILGGVLMKSFSGSLLLCGGAAVVMFLFNIMPSAQRFNPVTLISNNMGLLAGTVTGADFIPALMVSVTLILVSAATSIGIFNKKQL